jgi:hypothetical protein
LSCGARLFIFSHRRRAPQLKVYGYWRGQALALLVRLVLLIAAVAAQEQLADHQACRGRALHHVAPVVVAHARIIGSLGSGAAVAAVGLADQHAGHQEVAEHAHQGGLALHVQVVLLDDVADLVAHHVGEHVVVQPQVQHAGGDEDLAGGQGEGVRDGHLDDAEDEGELLEFRLLGQLIADTVDPGELLGVL